MDFKTINPARQALTFWDEFRAFAFKGNVVELAQAISLQDRVGWVDGRDTHDRDLRIEVKLPISVIWIYLAVRLREYGPSEVKDSAAPMSALAR